MLGVLYMEQNLYNKAKKFLDNSIDSFIKLQDYSGTADQYVNLGKLYNESEKNYDKAISYYKMAVKNYKKISNDRSTSVALSNIGRNFIHLNKLDSAKFYFNKSLKLTQTIQYDEEIGRTLTNLGEIEFKKENYYKAKSYLFDALKITKKNNFILDYSDALLLLSDVYKEEGNFNMAYNSYVQGKKTLDSLNSIEKLAKITEIETKYQTEKKEKELVEQQKIIKEQELIAEKANTLKWIFGIGLLAIALTSFFIWRKYKAEEKAKNTISYQKDEIENQKNLVEKLQKELHHRLKNDFRTINSFIRLAKAKFPDQAYQERLSELQNRITSMFSVHTQLHKQDDVTQIIAKPYLEGLAENIKHTHGRDGITLQCKVDDDEILLSDKAIPIGIMLNEFVTNSYKHAFENNQGVINISLSSDIDNYHLLLQDDGKGLSKDFDIDNLTTFGMEIIKLLTIQHKGVFELQGTNGVTINISLPKQVA